MKKVKNMRKFNYFYRKREKERKGFTLIEVIVALAILAIIIGSTFDLLASSYANTQDAEMRNIAKNIAAYTVEYIRSRNVTADNPLGHSAYEFGNDDSHYYPGLVDLWNLPVQANGHPSGTQAGAISININPALPKQTYQDNPYAFYYSLQGYVSLGDFDYLSPANPSPEDANAYICNYSIKHYHDRLYKVSPASENGHAMGGNHYIIRFPFNSTINNGTQPNPDAIRNFSAAKNYIPMIYTTDTNKTSKSSPEYDPHYTNDASLKRRTMAYRGFRVLTAIVARKKKASDPDHVQYYDVRVTVFWVTGKQEHSYSLATQIVTYGGS